MSEERTDAQGKKIGLRINQASAETQYINSFKSQATGDEYMLDLGINRVEPTGNPDRPAEVHFNVSSRLIMNYQTTKRLAISLLGAVRRYEEKFGEIEPSAAPDQPEA